MGGESIFPLKIYCNFNISKYLFNYFWLVVVIPISRPVENHSLITHVHPKLRNIDPQNVTHSLVSQNPRERMFVVQISLLIVTFLSLISRNLSLMQTTQEVNPHPHTAPCVNMWNVTFLFFFFFSLCHLLNVGACIRHIDLEGQVEWITLE